MAASPRLLPIAVLAGLALSLAGVDAAWAEPAADAPISTASKDQTSAQAKTDATVQQIKAWTGDDSADRDAGLVPDRRFHGEVTMGVGTGGYRQASVSAEGPVGDKGWVAVAVGTTQYGRRYR